jgi:hypothetical protein
MSSFSYVYRGKGTIGGNLIITAMSPSFGEKLWKKSIDMSKIPFEYASTMEWDTQFITFFEEMDKDPDLYNKFLASLETFYQQTFDLITKQIDVEEMKTVADEAKKVEKKG